MRGGRDDGDVMVTCVARAAVLRDSVSMIRAALPLFMLLATPAAAQDVGGTATTPAVVYELFTSQGCSSCPPANRQIARVADSGAEGGDALALSYGVTYWDYLGWKDTFAAPEFTDRQHAYVSALGGRNAYTPQIVRNGADHDSRLPALASLTTSLPEAVTLRAEGGRLRADGQGRAVLVTYTPGQQSVPVARGENGGRTLLLANVVTDVEEVALPHSFVPEPGLAYALLQHGDDLAITSAANWTPRK